MEPSSSNFIIDSLEIVPGIIDLPFFKAAINRLLYPQKYIHKGIVQVDEDNIILGDDKRDETILSFCELIFSHYAFLYLIDDIFKDNQQRFISDIIDAINRRFYNVRSKKYSTFREVHKFLLRFHKTNRARILNHFRFSNNTIIELLELLDEDYIYYLKTNYFKNSKCPINEDDEYFNNYYLPKHTSYSAFNYINENEDGKKNHVERYEWYSKDSHRYFVELIKRENYTPLFFAVLVYNYISKTTKRLDLVGFAFTDEIGFQLETLSIRDALKDTTFPADDDDLNLQVLVQNNHYFSDCKFREWVDEWFENFDSFINEDDFSECIDYESDEFDYDEYDYIENQIKINSDVSNFLLTRGWEIPGHEQLINDEEFLLLKGSLKEYVGNELKRKALSYSIIQDCIPDEERAVLNWWLSQTHYYKIFNKLVEYFTTKYLDKGKEQAPLQKSESSAIETSNEVEQQNIPVIIEDKDEAHKEWFIRVHEKKINAQPDEWNKKLYTCLDALYESLVKKGLMCESSKKELFIYRFSGFNIPESFNPLEKIRWEGSNVLLGYLVRCLITYTGSNAKGLGTVGTFFESKRGKKVNLATADYISKEDFNQNPNMYPVLSCAVEILKECGFKEVEATSTRKRDK